MSIFNIYSFVLLSGFVLAIGLGVVLLTGRRRNGWLALGALTVLIIGLWWLVKPVETTLPAGSAPDAAIGQGLPVLIEAQSPY